MKPAANPHASLSPIETRSLLDISSRNHSSLDLGSMPHKSSPRATGPEMFEVASNELGNESPSVGGRKDSKGPAPVPRVISTSSTVLMSITSSMALKDVTRRQSAKRLLLASSCRRRSCLCLLHSNCPIGPSRAFLFLFLSFPCL